MIEREFLFWVIFGTSFVSYSIGYFLWLFVHWYYDERPEKRHAELRAKAINEYNKQHKEEAQLTKEERDYYRNLGKPRDPKVLTADEQLDLIFGTEYAEHAKQEGADWKAKQPPSDPRLSPDNPQTFGEKFLASSIEANKRYRETNPNPPPAKTSGEPEKKGDDRLPPKEKPDPYWAVISPGGKTVCIKSAKIPYEVYKYYAEKIVKVSTLMLDARGYRVQSYIPTSPPPPPSPLYNHLFHYERKPNA